MSVHRRIELGHLLIALGSVAAVTAMDMAWLHVANATTAALSYLLIVLFVAASSQLWVAIVASIAAMLTFNFFFLAPVGTLAIADPQNWIALCSFLVVSLVASRLSAVARARQRDALSRRDDLARLFDLSRDILLTTAAGSEAIAVLARHLAGCFQLDFVSIGLPAGEEFERYEAGELELGRQLTTETLRRGLQDLEPTVSLDRTPGDAPPAHARPIPQSARLMPLRLGKRTIGVLAIAGRPIEPGTLDTLGSVVAIAIERIHFLEERRQAELAQRGAEFKSALLASLAHDLRTPLTAIRVAADNLQTSWLSEVQRGEQADIVLGEVERLTRLFDNILEMTRIEAGAVTRHARWVHPSEIIAAAKSQVGRTAARHHVIVREPADDRAVHLDPRLTSAALAHLLENAAQYSPPGSTIEISYDVTGDGLRIAVEDEGRGITAADEGRLFEPFFRGEQRSRHSVGTGMGLAITRGLLAAEEGRVWAENRPRGGARFTILVPAGSRPLVPAEADQS